jgi:hypothetical protein
VAQDRDWRRAAVNAAMNLRVLVPELVSYGKWIQNNTWP